MNLLEPTTSWEPLVSAANPSCVTAKIVYVIAKCDVAKSWFKPVGHLLRLC